MTEKAKRGEGFATFGLRRGCRIIVITTGFMLALMIGGFLACVYLVSPPDASLMWSPDSRYLALERRYNDLVIYDLVEQTNTVHLQNFYRASARGFYDATHLWVEWYGMGGTRTLSYDIQTRQMGPSVGAEYDYGINPHINLRFVISPDHTTLTYAWSKGRNYDNGNRGLLFHDLYQIDLTTNTVTRLTNTPEIDEGAPQYAPDGSFLVAGDSTFKNGMWTQIPNFHAESGRYSLSPDGQWILNYQENPDAVWEKTSKEGDRQQSWRLVSQSRPNGLYLLPIDGHAEPRLIQNGPFTEIAWSPNGCYIAYAQSGPPRFSIVLASDWGLGEFVEPDADCKPYPNSIFG